MTNINMVEIDTIYGYKAIELHEGDLTLTNFEVDLLVVSAFKNDYIPTKGSLIGSLQINRSISLAQLAQNPSIDLRESLGVWISNALKDQPYSRIACIEMLDYYNFKYSVEESIKNLFSLISMADMQDIKINSLAMPLIGTGQQGIYPEMVLEVLIPICLKALNTIPHLDKIIFVEYSQEKVEILDKTMNQILKRTETDIQSIPDNELTGAVRHDLIATLNKLEKSFLKDNRKINDNTTIEELLIKLKDESLRFFELGLLSRRLCELIVMDILEVNKLKGKLINEIDKLSEKKISRWIISYLHILRIFGNEVAHEKGTSDNIPAKVDQQDLTILLFCLNRIIEFWRWYRNDRINPVVNQNSKIVF